MDISQLNLSIHEYCAEDDTRSVEGQAPGPVDLEELKKEAEKISSRVIMMERLGVLVVVLDSVTAHIHRNGKISINGVRSIEEARTILARLQPASPSNE